MLRFACHAFRVAFRVVWWPPMPRGNDAPEGDLFFSLTPELVLDAVERAGLRTEPVCAALNSFENRVYEVTLDRYDDASQRLGSAVVAKFYRPGRWSKAQLLEEQEFIADCAAAELPVCRVLPFPNGETLAMLEDPGGGPPIYYCIFERKRGRAPDELSDELVERLGMLVGRLHNVGAAKQARTRVRLDGDTLIRKNVRWLIESGRLPEEVRERYEAAALGLADVLDTRLQGVAVQRVHGDLHLGNLVLRPSGTDGVFSPLHVLDFDDFAIGPPVQDLWLIVNGRDRTALRQREIFIEAYEQLRAFDRRTLSLIEPLRGARWVHYAAWLARRWHDPVFPITWPHVGGLDYWLTETRDLEEQLRTIEYETHGAPPDETADLSNKDFFWDWDDK